MPPQKMETCDMRKLILFAIVVLAGTCSGKLALAQAHQVGGKIPFDFNAGSTRLSAGEYRITYDISGVVTFRNLEKGSSVAMLVGPDRPVQDGTCKLIFARSGGQYFLRQSTCSMADVNFFLPNSQREKKAREVAAASHDVEQIVVAMK
jgi:hypothetical protein